MLRRELFTICRRFYNRSSSTGRQRAPVVRVASTRVNRAIKERLDDESRPRVPQYDPTKRFEPFPFAVTEDNKVEILRRTVTPLYDIPYEEQLAAKESYCRNSLRYLAQRLYKSGTPVRIDVKKLPCYVSPIVRSPATSNYRNKDEFSIWRGTDGETPTVGYMAFPISKHGDTICIEPNGCTIMKEESTKLVDLLQIFIRHQAKLPVCYSLGAEGGWRRFIVKVNSVGEIMLIGQVSPRTLKVQQLLDERNNFKDFLLKRTGEEGLKLTSLYFQPCPHSRCSHKDVPFELLHGDKTLKETIGDQKFVISPESYIPQNLEGAEELYKAVRKQVEGFFPDMKPDSKPLIVDASCGVGILAIKLSDLASKVVGVDSNVQAIEDARANVELNDVQNTEFICTNLEIALERILEKHSNEGQETLVVCSPTRSGLHRHVVEALRSSKSVRKIIFVTSKLEKDSVMDNLLTLCQKPTGKGLPPFVPVSATPVDVYPHLEACELVLALERLPQ